MEAADLGSERGGQQVIHTLLLLTLVAIQDTAAGKMVYTKWCAGCHGDNGAGDGQGARHMIPPPRDFTGAIYQIRSTPSGQLPTDADLLRSIDEGLGGTAMPGWKSRLSERQRRDVLAYIKTFSTFFADTTQRPQPIAFSKEPGGDGGADALKVGRQFYDSIGCRKCHGDQGRGDGPSAPTLKDDAGHPMFAANLHENWRFNGGGTVEDIYRRLRTGLDGTPMPSFSDLLEQKFLTDEQLWRVAEYVRSLSPKEPPVVRDVIHAPLTKRVPHAPDDSAWTAVDTYWFPLVGQIIRKERWFAPAVSGVWVKAVHTADSIAIRVAWDDRSQSPDTAWLAHLGRVFSTLVEGSLPSLSTTTASGESSSHVHLLRPTQPISFRCARAVPSRWRFLPGMGRTESTARAWPSVPGISSPSTNRCRPGCSSRRCSPWCSLWGWACS